MAMDNNIELVITMDSNRIMYEYIKTNGEEKKYDPDEYEEKTIRIELQIARTFHKILNLLSIEKDLFQKEDFELLGEMLRKILFGKVGKIVLEDMIFGLLESAKGKTKCRIYLEFEKNCNLAILPWEYTIIKDDKDKSIYLAANKEKNFDFIRRIDGKGNPGLVNTNKLNCILIISSIKNKEDNIPSVGDSEVKAVTDLFNELKKNHSDQFDFQVIENPSFENLRKELENAARKFEPIDDNVPPYCIHYLGHSAFDDNGGRIVFCKEDNNSHWIKDIDFAQVFDSRNLEIDIPVLYVLQSCDSAKLSNYGAGKGVALSLVNQKIPAVLGMQNEVDVETSTEFMKRFYEALLKGSDVGEAVTIGRTFLGKGEQDEEGKYINNITDWYTTNSFGSPVLFITTIRPIYFFEKKTKVLNEIKEKYVFKKCRECGDESEVPISQTNCRRLIREPLRPPRVCNGILDEMNMGKEMNIGAVSDVNQLKVAADVQLSASKII